MTGKKMIKEYIIITLGVILMSISISIFYEPNKLVTGGVTGLAIILRQLSSQYIGYAIPIWLTNIVMNVPLFAIGLKLFGLKNLTKTIYATTALSLSLYITVFLPPFITEDLILVSIFGGVLSGSGLGLVFRCMATTGGSDMAASIINRHIKHVSTSKIMFLIDSTIILFGFFVFGATKAMYAIIIVFISTKVIDAIQEGLSFAKAAFIISEYSEEISHIIMQEIQRGITGLEGKGMYTKKTKNVLLCVVSNKEIVRIKELVYKADKNAFVIVADVREVLGEGFKTEF